MAPTAGIVDHIAPVEAAPPARVEQRRERRPEPALPAAVPAIVVNVPPVALALPADSGLVLVETTHRADLPVEPDSRQPNTPRRTRRERVQLPDESLLIVETRKDQPAGN